VRRPARAVEAEEGVRGHGHAQVAFEDPCEYASVKEAKGAGPLDVRQAAMGDLPPDMAPRWTSQARCRREDVRRCVGNLTRGPFIIFFLFFFEGALAGRGRVGHVRRRVP
jgi:hypothetical protein